MKKNNLSITLGKDSNNLVYRDSLFDICHILVGGSKDKEKDKLFTNIIKDLIYYNKESLFKIALIDFTRGDYSWIPKNHLYNYPITKTVPDSFIILEEVYEEAKRRVELLDKANIKNINAYNEINKEEIDSIILIITEYKGIIEKDKEKFTKMITYLLEHGRICNIFVLLGTKEMTKQIVTKEIESLFPSKICFDTENNYESNVILEYTHAENLKDDEFIYLTSSKTDYAVLKLL